MNKKTIILIHGLFMSGFSMKIMARKFKKENYNIYYFEYPTVKFDVIKTNENLHALIESIPSEEIYLIGHSMGGLVARLYCTEFETSKVKKVITIASPHNGSHIAKFLIKTRLKNLLGSCGDSGIIETLPVWKNKYPLGCIAAISKLGVNTILTPFHRKKGLNDGNVFLDEALLMNAKDITIVPHSHSGVLLSNIVIKECIHFLETGNFLKISSHNDLLNKI